MSELHLSEDVIAIILKQRFKDCEAKCRSYEISPVAESNIGFMGKYYTLNIEYSIQHKALNEKFFVKTHKQFNETGDIIHERNVFPKETFFYDFLRPEFAKHGYDTSFAPQCYYCQDSRLIVLENLVEKEYKLCRKFDPFDLHKCKVVLKTLTLIHGASMLYEEEMTRQLGSQFRLGEQHDIFEEQFFAPQQKDGFAYTILNLCVNFARYVADQLPDDKYKAEFKKRLNLDDLLAAFKAPSRLRKTFSHGDLWFNNIFFGYENLQAVKCCLVDFQIMRYFHPAFDVLMFLYLNTTRAFRKEYFSALLQFYYDHLSEVICKHGGSISTIFPVADYRESLTLVRSAVLFAVAVCNMLVLMPQERITEYFNTLGGSSDKLDIQLNVFCKAFNTDQRYREIITEDILNLRDAVFEPCEYELL